MIFDKLSNLEQYKNIPQLTKIVDYLKENDISQLEPGTYEIDGDKLFIQMNLVDLKTIDEARLEAHDKYIDLQIVFQTEELMGFAHRADLGEPDDDKRPEKDIFFWNSPEYDLLTVNPGSFVVFFPEDAHAPNIGDGFHKKAIIKIAVDYN